MSKIAKLSVFVRMVLITPEKARYWIENFNPDNRHVRLKRVEMLADAIKKGQWMQNGETIKFTPQGRLLDGQHRLHAIIMADQPVWCAVAYNVPETAMGTIDVTAARTAGDLLKFNGYVDCNRLAAASKAAYCYEGGWFKSLGGKNVHPVTILEYIKDNPDIEKIKNLIGDKGAARAIPAQIIGLCFILYKHGDKQAAEKMASGMGSGFLPSSVFHPVREKILTTRMSAGLNNLLIWTWGINAFNAHLKGEKKFSHRVGEELPKIERYQPALKTGTDN